VLVIFEVNLFPLNPLFLVLILLKGEHVLVKLLLKLLISVVDTQLLEAIFSKDFKAKYIEETDETLLLCFRRLSVLRVHVFRNFSINLLDDPREEC
jgi:hypothetical protein